MNQKTKEEMNKEIKSLVIKSQAFTELVGKISKDLDLEPFAFCLSVRVMSDACEHAFAEEWTAAQQLFNETVKGKRNANQ